jgi:hypothetical protein
MLTAIKEGPDHSSIVKFAEIQIMQKLPFFREDHILSNCFTTSGGKHLTPILMAS